ncbi:unnamed protein product, partial [Vitis vinifera]|uniref:Carboxypeptidase A inhibitor-like domain-containing protein n=1 Tax=Vitis vinifera TaxID=29760 RepID=D7TJR1_VITVI
MATRVRVSIFVPVFIVLLLAALYESSHGDDQVISHSVGAIRSLSGARKNSQIPDCNEMASNSQCSQNSKCRWCRSDALDDMCFSKAEAWRLPQQN